MVDNPMNSISKIENKTPLISFVLAGRNDNYGGDFKLRLQRCVTNLFTQLKAHQIPSEIIFVNYNPLPDNQIEHFISWPQSIDLIQIRIITVPTNLHSIFVENYKVKNVPVLEYPAKNAGIRRANGTYILSMNPDIIIDDAFFGTINQLKKDNYYRCNRLDFQLDDANSLPADWIPFIKKNVIKVWVKAISKEIKIGSFSKYKFYLILLLQKLEIIRYSLLRALNFLWSTKLHPKAENKFHCNVSGDFMLMHKEHWNTLTAYKENSYLALHVDALMVVQAATLGLKEVVMKYPIYHQEHERRYDAKKENVDFRDAYMIFQEDAQKMIKNKKPLQYNSIDWGFANSKLEEILL